MYDWEEYLELPQCNCRPSYESFKNLSSETTNERSNVFPLNEPIPSEEK